MSTEAEQNIVLGVFQRGDGSVMSVDLLAMEAELPEATVKAAAEDLEEAGMIRYGGVPGTYVLPPEDAPLVDAVPPIETIKQPSADASGAEEPDWPPALGPTATGAFADLIAVAAKDMVITAEVKLVAGPSGEVRMAEIVRIVRMEARS